MTTRQSFYDRIGGAQGVERLINTFCDVLETTEEGKPVYLLHLRGHGMDHARVEQVNFFSGFLGGPRLYAEKWGHSNIRQIHDHVALDRASSDAWLNCMSMTLDQLAVEDDLKEALMKNFTAIAELLLKEKEKALTH